MIITAKLACGHETKVHAHTNGTPHRELVTCTQCKKVSFPEVKVEVKS